MMTAPDSCPSCGTGVPAPAPRACAGCSVSLAPDAADTQLTLVTRGDSATRRVTAQLDLSPAFRAQYRLERCLGSGAAGTVFRARQLSVDRPVAVKFLMLAGGPEVRERFAREARLLARLRHPRLLAIIEQGETGGLPYLVTELLPGPTLRERLREVGRLPAAQALEVAADLAAALAACHAAGVVHRDLKPENVMFDAEGRARLLDLGLARRLEDGDALTRTGALIGTPRYMAPEQATGDEIGPAADTYALGCMVFEMLAGRSPFGGSNIVEMLQAHAREPAPLLHTVAPDLPPALSAAVARCLEKQPARRPPPVEAVAAMRAALDVKRTEARPRGMVTGGTVRRPRRRPWKAAIAAGAALLAVAIGLAVSWPGRRAGTPEPAAVRPAASPREILPEASAAPADAGPRLVRTVPEWWACHPGLRALGVSRDGRFVASGSDNGTVRLWDRQERRMRWEVRTGLTVDRIEWMDGDSRVISRHLSRDRALGRFGAMYRCWEVDGGRPVGDPVEVTPLISSGELSELVSATTRIGTGDGIFAHWRALPGDVLARNAALSPDRALLAVREPEAVALWEMAPRRLRWRRPARRGDDEPRMVFGPGGAFVCLADGDRVLVYRTASGDEHAIPFHGRVQGIELSGDGTVLAALVVHGGGVWHFCDPATGVPSAPSLVYDAHLALSGDGRLVILGAFDRVGHAVRDGERWSCVEDPLSSMVVALGADARRAVVRDAPPRKGIAIWERADGSLRQLEGPDQWIEQARSSPFGPEVVLMAHGAVDRTVWFADAREGGARRMRLPTMSMLRPLAAGQWLEVGETGELWLLAGGHRDRVGALPREIMQRYAAGTHCIGHLVRPDPWAQRVALVGPQGSVDLVDVRAGRVVSLTSDDLLSHDQATWYTAHEPPAAFTNDGSAVFCQTGASEVLMFETAGGTRVRRFRGARGRVTALAVSPDDRMLAVGREDGSVSVWFVPTGRPIAQLDTRAATVCQIAVDARTLLTVGDDHILREWELPPEKH